MKKLVLLAMLGTLVTVTLASRGGDDAAPEANRLLADRIWIDQIPRGERDTVNLFALLSEHSIGIFDASSAWRGQYELFRFEVNGGELRLVYPQTGKRETAHAKAKHCKDNGMDFCLELSGASHGVKKYYSKEGWEIDRANSLDAVRHRLDGLRAQLAGD